MTEPSAAAERGPTTSNPALARGRLATAHALLVRTRFYPAAACSVLALALLGARSGWAQQPAYLFFVWNLFLAWLPWVLALPLAVLPSPKGRSWRTVPLFCAWLVFLPNAPYLVTDLIHLRPRGQIPFWFDGAMFFVFAWTGCVLGFASLSIIHARIERWLGAAWGWTFVFASALLTGFGLYLGRFLRWNSWDVIARPRVLIDDFADRVIAPRDHPMIVVFTVVFAAFFVAAYGSVRALPLKDGAPDTAA